jgi:glycerol-3-phosphate dehydrogenase
LADAWRAQRPWLTASLAWRLAHQYGTRGERILGEAGSLDALGIAFGAELYQAEVDYLREHEWAQTAEDILWRRSKLGLHVTPADAARLAAYLADTQSAAAGTA